MKTMKLNRKQYRDMSVFQGITAAVLITTFAVAPPLLEQATKFDFGSTVYAAHTGNGQNGNGDAGGGDGNGNKGGGGSGGNKGGKSDKGELFGDQVYLDRDINGVPYATHYDIQAEGEFCLRPIIKDSDPVIRIPLIGDDYEQAEVDALCPGEPAVSLVSSGLHNPLVAAIAAEEDETDVCDVVPQCLYLLEEVELGRVSVIRAPEKVLDRQVQDAIRTIGNSSFFWLDPGGRLMTGLTDNIELASTFDSPLVNLGMFRDYLLYGELGGMGVGDWIPGVPPADFDGSSYTPIQAAAFGFAAGDDKYGNPVDAEVMARTAKILALENGAYLPTPWDGPIIENEVGNEIGQGEEKYFNVSDFENYDREATYPGNVCYFVVSVNGVPDGTYYKESIMDQMFNGEANTEMENISGFAQAAEDARKVIAFTHGPGDVLTAESGNTVIAALIWADSVYKSEKTDPCGP